MVDLIEVQDFLPKKDVSYNTLVLCRSSNGKLYSATFSKQGVYTCLLQDYQLGPITIKSRCCNFVHFLNSQNNQKSII